MHQASLRLWSLIVPISRRPCGLLRDTRGNISIELAFVTVLLVVFAMGVVDFGRVVVEELRLSSAAAAGTQYAIQDDSTVDDKVGIAAAVRRDAGSDSADKVAVDSRSFCACPGEAASACTNVCGDGNYPPRFVEVSVARPLPLLFTYPGIASPQLVDAVSTMRLR